MSKEIVTFRRRELRECEPGPTTHAGLWLDRFLMDNGEQAKWNLVDMVTRRPMPSGYVAVYDRWKASLDMLLPQTLDFAVKPQAFAVRGRMVVGLGMEATLENSIALHRTYGIPYIPGSALKGLAASYAHRRLAASDSSWSKGAKPQGKAAPFHQTLFGDTTSAGYITFFDAWYIPGSVERDTPLHRDVLTVHHQQYYQGDLPPADWDNPVPVPFLSATGCYLVVLAGPKLWMGMALELLTLALREDGIGAKTSSGYGRMEPVDESKVRSKFRGAGAIESRQPASATRAQPTPVSPPAMASEQYPQQAAPDASAPQPGIAIPQTGVSRTAEGTVVGVGAQDASLLLPGNRRGRARFGPTLPRKPNSGERVLVELDADGNPVLIVEIL